MLAVRVGRRRTKLSNRFADKEKNYVDTKLHTYSRMLVDMAIKHECSEIVLKKQKERADEAKDNNKDGDNFVLRNWGVLWSYRKDKVQG